MSERVMVCPDCESEVGNRGQCLLCGGVGRIDAQAWAVYQSACRTWPSLRRVRPNVRLSREAR